MPSRLITQRLDPYEWRRRRSFAKPKRWKQLWREIATALCLVLIFEGILPFLDPRGWQRTLVRVAQVHPGAVRLVALVTMVVGLMLLHWVRSPQ